MIRFRCPKCGKEFKAKDEYAGRKFSCDECGRDGQIPTVQELQRPSAIATADPVPRKIAPAPNVTQFPQAAVIKPKQVAPPVSIPRNAKTANPAADEELKDLPTLQPVERIAEANSAPRRGAVWLWLGGVLLILDGFGGLSKFPDVFASPFLIIAGALLLPPVWKMVLRKVPAVGSRSTLIRTVACVAAFLIAGALLPKQKARVSSADPPWTHDSSPTHTETAQERIWKEAARIRAEDEENARIDKIRRDVYDTYEYNRRRK